MLEEAGEGGTQRGPNFPGHPKGGEEGGGMWTERGTPRRRGEGRLGREKGPKRKEGVLIGFFFF